jgi:uncharacterized protein YyaL (SSP411 family)
MAWATLKSISPMLRRYPTAAGQALIALDFLLAKGPEVVICSPLADQDYRRARAMWASRFLPGAVILPNFAGNNDSMELARDRSALSGHITSFICSGQACETPVVGLEALKTRLTGMPTYL